MKFARLVMFGFCATTAVLNTGCGVTEVRKVPTPGNYPGHWTESDQREADQIKGFRFYMPRPFLALKKEYPVESATFLVEARFSQDGSRIVFDVHASGDALENAIGAGTWSVPVAATSAGPKGENLESGDEEKKEGDDDKTKKTPTNTTSIGNAGATPKSVAKISELFDVVYLPDFSEQYAIQVKPRLSKASLDAQLGHGWMLESAKVDIDNSAIGEFLFNQVDSTLDVFRDALRLDKGLLTPEGEEEPEDAGEDDAAGGPQGASVDGVPDRKGLVRILVRQLAVPGLYPILKAREITAVVSAHNGFPQNGVYGCNANSPLVIARVGVICINTRTEILIKPAMDPASTPINSAPGPTTNNCDKDKLRSDIVKLAASIPIPESAINEVVVASNKVLRIGIDSTVTEEAKKQLENKIKPQLEDKTAREDWCHAESVAIASASEAGAG